MAKNASNQLELYWVHDNHLGVPIVTTNAAGQVVTPANDFLRPGFPGQSEVLADFYYNRARDYDPVLGRYIQADPIGLMGDVNPYLYANADPVNMIDPLGLKTYWEHYTGLPDSYRQNAINATAGWSDTFTFGVTYGIRELLGANRDVRICDPYYAGGSVAGLISPGSAARTLREWYRFGKEFKIGPNFRIAPFGNRNAANPYPPNRYGRWPHYHRQRVDNKGRVKRDQGMGRHRPWEPRQNDNSWRDRF